MEKANILRMYLSRIIPLLFIAAACTQVPESDEAKTTDAKEVTVDTAAAQVFTIDTSQSKVEWIGTKVSGYHSGVVNVKSGELQVKGDQVVGGKFIMDMTSIEVTGPAGSRKEANDKLQQHLLSADFFETSRYPEATFEITGVKAYTGRAIEEKEDPRQDAIGKYKVKVPSHTVAGNLTMKGTTKNIEFPAYITVTGSYADALAKFNIDRKLWNITYPGKPDDLIRDEIHLGISLLTVAK